MTSDRPRRLARQTRTSRENRAGLRRARVAPGVGAHNRWLLLCVVVLLTGCGTDDAAVRDSPAYRSFWAELYPGSLAPGLSRDTLQGAFQHAAAADTEASAESRWAAFLAEWDPGAGGFEDAMHARYVGWARLEQERLRYLERNEATGARAAEDRLRALAAEYE